jgi:hypothetical protein
MIPAPIKILKLLVAELDNRMELEAKSMQKQTFGATEDEEEEGEEWEDVDDDSEQEYGQLLGKIPARYLIFCRIGG